MTPLALKAVGMTPLETRRPALRHTSSPVILRRRLAAAASSSDPPHPTHQPEEVDLINNPPCKFSAMPAERHLKNGGPGGGCNSMFAATRWSYCSTCAHAVRGENGSAYGGAYSFSKRIPVTSDSRKRLMQKVWSLMQAEAEAYRRKGNTMDYLRQSYRTINKSSVYDIHWEHGLAEEVMMAMLGKPSWQWRVTSGEEIPCTSVCPRLQHLDPEGDEEH